MAEFPALPLWTDAYLGDTTHLTTIEHGAYLLLLMVAWRSRDTQLPDDDKLLARYTRTTPQQWGRLRPVIAEFFDVENGQWRQRRLSDEATLVRQVRERQASAGRLSALKRKGRHSTERQQSVNGASTPTPTPTPTVEDTGVSSPPTPKSKRAKPTAKATPISTFKLPDWIPPEAWQAFEEMRDGKKAPMTDGARDRIVAQLEKWRRIGQPPGDVLDQSTRSRWTDVYELKGNNNGHSHNGNRPNRSNDGFLNALDDAARNLSSDDARGG